MTLPPGPFPDPRIARDDTPDDPADEFQGDVHAADIVAPTGEEMPIATHAEVRRRITSMHRKFPAGANADTAR